MLSILILCLTLGATHANPPSSCCGFANRASRIVGGTETEVREYPWQAALFIAVQTGPSAYQLSFNCGGSVINDRYVLTAAHCVEKNRTAHTYYAPADLFVFLGDHNLRASDGEQAFFVSAVIPHPSYNTTTVSNDIALLKLSSTISFADKRVVPACLPSSGQFPDVDVIVTGWGRTSYGGLASTVLLEVGLRTITNDQCRNVFNWIGDDVLCALYAAGGKGPCNGDSGGPLVTELAANRYQLVGVVSFGYKCALPGVPGAFARVTEFYDWIMANTADANLC